MQFVGFSYYGNERLLDLSHLRDEDRNFLQSFLSDFERIFGYLLGLTFERFFCGKKFLFYFISFCYNDIGMRSLLREEIKNKSSFNNL